MKTKQIDFAETKFTVILFVYSRSTEVSGIHLITPTLLQINSKLSIKLYKDITSIEKVVKTPHCVEITLNKKDKFKWYTLKGPTYIKGKIEAECHEDFDEVSDTCDDVLSVLTRIYQNGDDDTRRAMEKSFVESKGTVLSTNWKDVKDKTVEAYALPHFKKEEKNRKE